MVSLSPLMMLALPVVLLPLKFRIELLVIVALPIVLVFRDYPNADPFMLHIYAAVAEQERTKISERTKAALAAAKNHPKG
jgi:hypothetical protein